MCFTLEFNHLTIVSSNHSWLEPTMMALELQLGKNIYIQWELFHISEQVNSEGLSIPEDAACAV